MLGTVIRSRWQLGAPAAQKGSRYRCFLSDLTEFATLSCAGPSHHLERTTADCGTQVCIAWSLGDAPGWRRDERMADDDLATIILVGGRSSRMGRPKPWLDLDGQSLLARVVEQVRTWSTEIVLVATPGQALPSLVGVAPLVVHDDRPGAGPLPALAIGLESVRASWALLLGCDAPLVHPSVVAHLAAARRADVDAVVPIWDDRPQPLLALYRRVLAPRMPGARRGR